jgi:CheY-like chemotaxis protein
MSELRHILLAEDDPRDVELILEALSEYKLANKIIVTRDGQEALDYLHRTGQFAGRPPGNPAVLLLDLKMPRLDGIDVIKQVKGEDGLKSLPIVVLTSSRESNDLDTCYRLGVNAYVVKPVRFPDFMAAVKQLAMFWALINEPPPAADVLEAAVDGPAISVH